MFLDQTKLKPICNQLILGLFFKENFQRKKYHFNLLTQRLAFSRECAMVAGLVRMAVLAEPALGLVELNVGLLLSFRW